jgi:hypothetical protein
MNQMLIYLFLLFNLYFVGGNPRETLIFIDKTESVKYSGGILVQAKSEMEELIVQRFYKGNDGLKVYFIHGYTSASKASQSFKVFLPSCDAKLPSLKKQLCLSNYQKRLNILRKSVLDSLVKTLQLEASTQTKNSTDIFGAIETACNQRKLMIKATTNGNIISDLHVYIFSDMIQTSNFINLKNIGQLTLSNVVLKTDKDLKLVRANYLNVDKTYLQGIIVHVKTPDVGISTPANMKNLKYYWETILIKLGVKEINWG